MRYVVSVAVALAVGLTCAPAWSAESPALEDRAAAIERVAREPDGERIVAGHVSRALGLSVETLRADRARTRLSWGQIYVAHRLSRAARLTLDQVVAEFQNGKAWEQIATDHDVNLAGLASDLERSQELVERRGDDQGAPRRDSGSTSSQPTGSGVTRGTPSGGTMGRGRY